MNSVRSLSIVFFITSSIFSFGQNTTNFTQFFVNPYSLNPSFAGIDGQKALFLAYKKQWADFENAPTTVNFSFHSPLKAGLNVGFNVHNDSRSVLTNSGLLMSVAYSLPFGEHKYFRFGLSAGGSWNGINLDELGDFSSDPAFVNAMDNSFSLNGNAGLSVHLKTTHIGVSIPTLFSPTYITTNSFSVEEVKPFQSLIIHANHRFYFARNKHIFEPYLVYRLKSGLPSQYEAAGVFHLNHVAWFGGSYKQDFGISGLAGIKMNNVFAVGASFSLKNTGINELNSSSYELQLSFLMGHKDKKTEAYSFVSTVRPKEKKKASPSQLAEKKKQEELAKKKKEELLAKQQEEQAAKKQQEAAEAKRKQDELAKKTEEEARKKAAEVKVSEPVVTKPQPVLKDSVVQPVTINTGGPRLKNQAPVVLVEPHEDEHGETERISRLEVHADDHSQPHGAEADSHPHSERHEFVEKGNHQQELDYGDYIIAGVFKSEANAKHFSDGLANLKFKSDYGHLTLKNLWYVYLLKTDDINIAKTERDKFRQTKMFRDSWLLTVHD